MRALISVFDKSSLNDFAGRLVRLGYEVVSTGGTADTLRGAGVPVQTIESVTGFPEILDGRVKTLHPRIHAGLLARTDQPDHLATLAEHDIRPIDLLVCNLYPFEATVANEHLGDQDKIEQIDIGGPAMVRAAAKNHASVIVVTDPSDYGAIADLIEAGGVDQHIRRSLAAKAFDHVATYDALVSAYLRDAKNPFPDELAIGLRKVSELRYGENPQQRAASYRALHISGGIGGLLDAEQLHGKELSFNNLLDGDTAWRASLISGEPTAAIIKHMVPCGLATRTRISDAFEAALDGDRVSAFGGIVSLNRPVDFETAERLTSIFLEIVIAPDYDQDALEVLQRKKNLRVLRMPPARLGSGGVAHLDVRPITGGMLVQTTDTEIDPPRTWKVVTTREPGPEEWKDLEFAWSAVRLVKSNAIVMVREQAVAGVGAGQPNRLESVKLAVNKAAGKATGASMASDAFFPFADGIQLALESGVTAIVQPGGSIRDKEVIDAANAAGATMVFTGVRHFRH